MSPISGVVIGITTQVREGEVKVKFPWLHEREGEEKESNWARIATAMAGNDKGTFLMPEVGDEVLVAFEQGDFNHPYIIGFLWNGKDEPPENDANKRVIKTKCGHVIEFDDNTGAEKITIKSHSGHMMEIDDSMGANKITIKSLSGQMMEINDTPPGNITISTGNPGAPVNINSITAININTATGMVKVDCLNATVTAKTNVTIMAPQTIFGGIVQAPLLQAEAVLSKAYNFGVPGNIFGL